MSKDAFFANETDCLHLMAELKWIWWPLIELELNYKPISAMDWFLSSFFLPSTLMCSNGVSTICVYISFHFPLTSPHFIIAANRTANIPQVFKIQYHNLLSICSYSYIYGMQYISSRNFNIIQILMENRESRS